MQENIKSMMLTHIYVYDKNEKTYITTATKKFRNITTTQTISSLKLCFSRKYISHFLDENIRRNGGVLNYYKHHENCQ